MGRQYNNWVLLLPTNALLKGTVSYYAEHRLQDEKRTSSVFECRSGYEGLLEFSPFITVGCSLVL
jgi:hypothetical protein